MRMGFDTFSSATRRPFTRLANVRVAICRADDMGCRGHFRRGARWATFRFLLILIVALGLMGCRTGYAPGLPEQLDKAVAAMPMPKAGVHPRVLFTRDELPAIRARARTPGGMKAVRLMAWEADHPGKAVLNNIRAGKPETAEKLVTYAFKQAFLYLITEEPARLAKAKELLKNWAAHHAKTDYYNRHGYQFALTYDWLYDKLPLDIRDAMRENIAALLSPARLRAWETKGYYKGPILIGRPCDWGAIDSGGAAMLWLAIAGEDPRASREFLASTVAFMQYLADFGMSAEGYMPAGNGYAGGDFVNYGYAVRALQVHGVPLVDHPHLQAFARWLAYESIPGQYVFDARSFSRGYHHGLSPLVLALAGRHGGAGAWLADQARGPDRAGSIRVPGVLWGEFSKEPPPPDMPLHHWSSSMGISFSRDGWAGGSFFCLNMEPLAPGKTHSDQGSFTFYSHGQNFAADSGGGFPKSKDHNTVLIDGKGQYNSGGMRATDAIPRAFLASKIADFNHQDVKSAYERYATYTRTRPGPVDWTRLEYGRGLPFRWEVFRPMRRADRYGLYVRGSVQPYVVILDDIQQDDTERKYQWLMHSRAQGKVAGPGHVLYRSRYGGEYVQSEKYNARVTFTAPLKAAGTYTVYVLMRKWPQLKNWFSHHIGIRVNVGVYPNGRSMSFRPADYLWDWQWVGTGTHELPAGRSQVTINGQRGLRIAQVVAIPDKGAPPVLMQNGKSEGKTPEGMIVFQRQPDLKPEEWSVRRDPRARMDLHFLQPGAKNLALDFWKKPRAVPVALRAGQKAVRAGFAAVLIPYDDRDPTPVLSRTGAAGAVLKWGPYTDYLYADPAHAEPVNTAAPLSTDGKFALVRTRNNEIIGYILVAGTRLAFHGQTLVTGGDGPIHVLHDGETCTIHAPSGARGQVARLAAGKLVCNRHEQTTGKNAMATFRAPVLAKEWKVSQSSDGRTVTVEGAGSLPLKIHGPRAVKCVLNDVSVWFSRDGFGNIYPKVELTELTHGKEPLNSTPADGVPKKTGPVSKPMTEIPLPRDGWRFQKDAENVGRDKRWFDVGLNDQAWSLIGIADFWDNFGIKHTGFGWYRRSFKLPDKPAQCGKVELAFDAVDEMAWVWLNGKLAGEYFEYGPAGWTEPFSFDVTRLVRWGAENQITVRVKNTAAAGGIYKPVCLRVFAPTKANP